MKRNACGTVVQALSTTALLGASLPGQAMAASEDELLRRIERLEAQLQQQAAALEAYRSEVDQYREVTATHIGELTGARAGQASAGGAQGEQAETESGTPSEPVGQAPEGEGEREEVEGVTALYDVGGVLTPKGHVVLEPSLEYSHASANRFTFRGVELQEVVLIGVIEAEDADRDFVSASLTGRLGVTDRFELEARVPYVYRDDTLTFSIPVLGEEELERTSHLSNHGIGDVELAGHYQFNSGRGGGPVFVGNLRFGLPTGEGPFDVDRDEFGVEEELPTGSGFYSIEPSVTAILPSDPAVLFANLGYEYRVKDSDIDEPVGDFIVEEVDPGDSIKASVGMGFAVNDELSFTLGYKHAFLMETKTQILNPENNQRVTESSGELHIGSGLLGFSYKVSDNARVNLEFELGITEDAPDMRAMLRLPVDLGKLF